MTVADIFIFSLGFLVACVLGLIVARMVWVRAVRITRARLERDRPETLRTFEARIAGAQARAAVSIRELERTLERERQISAQARLMADQMTSSTAIAAAERDDTQSALVNLSDTLDQTRERLRDHEDLLTRRNTEIANLRRDISDIRQDLAMRSEDVRRAEAETESLRTELTAQLAGDKDPRELAELAKAGGAAAIARQQIEDLREELRVLRAEKNAAEASAARARLLLDARDDSATVEAERKSFETERNALQKQIATLEADAKRPRLVAVSNSDDEAGEPLDALRQSIDAMTASLTANAALESGKTSKINQLLDEAQDSAQDNAGDKADTAAAAGGGLVTSLVEARERLRSKSAAPTPNADITTEVTDTPASAARQAAAKLAARSQRTPSTGKSAAAKTAKKSGAAKAEPGSTATPSAGSTKIKAAAARGKSAGARANAKADPPPSDEAEGGAKRTRAGLPRASESDLKVI